MLMTLPLLLMALHGSPDGNTSPTAASALISSIWNTQDPSNDPAPAESREKSLRRIAAKRREKLNEQRNRRSAEYRRSLALGHQDGYFSQEYLNTLGPGDTGFSLCAPICEGGSGSCQ